MNLTMILEMAASAGDRAVVTAGDRSLSAPNWGQRLVAVVALADGADLDADLDEDGIRQWVRDRLRSSKTPDSVVFRTELPRTDTGKLLRRTLLAELETTHA